MRRGAAALAALALVATGCSDGVRRATPTTTPATSAAVTATPIVTPGMLVYATRTEVRAVAPDGTDRRLGSGTDVTDLAVSADGRYVAFVTNDVPVAVTVHDLATNDQATWTAPDDTYSADRIRRSNDLFVVVAHDTLLRFGAASTLAGSDPESIPLTGVTNARLLDANDARVVVGVSEENVASVRGGPETVFEVDATGRTTRLFNDGDGQPEGEVRNLAIGTAALSPDGRRLYYSTGAGGFETETECNLVLTMVARDLVTNREVSFRPPPPLPGNVVTAYDLGHALDGRVVAGLTTELGGCPQPSAAATYVLDGDTWKRLARNATWAATGPDGRLATISPDEVLTVDGRRVATRVVRAMWAPV